MTQVTYSSRFNGHFTPANDNGTALKGRTQGTVVEEGAEVRSTIIYTSETTFRQYGVITFENSKDTLHFSTQGPGKIDWDGDKKVKLGSAVLRIDYGHGRFEGAEGLITSNFVVNDDGEVSDSQVGMVEVR